MIWVIMHYATGGEGKRFPKMPVEALFLDFGVVCFRHPVVCNDTPQDYPKRSISAHVLAGRDPVKARGFDRANLGKPRGAKLRV